LVTGQYSNVLHGREGVQEADPHDIMARIDPTQRGTKQTMNENDAVIRLVSSFYIVVSTQLR